jgi:fatty-acyl-CoA synthase
MKSVLTPLDFLERSAWVYRGRTAVVDGGRRFTYAQFHERVNRQASALGKLGIAPGDRVAVLAPNTVAALEAQFGVILAGAVLVMLNTRLQGTELVWILNHCEARAAIVDPQLAPLLESVRGELPHLAHLISDYEGLLAQGEFPFAATPPDEDGIISVNYTSGTTGFPKGVMYTHRGAYLNAVGEVLEHGLTCRSVYLWTLPLFHCNGWCFPWTVAARAGVNVCLRKFDAKTVFELIRTEGVTHYCGAPIVQSALANAPEAWREGIGHRVATMVAGAAPAPAVIARMKEIGFDLTHVYGLTEVYGPASVCARQEHWNSVGDDELARLNARQGVRYHLQAAATVLDPDTLEPVPNDGETLGEIMFRGNICMKGYLKNERATEEAFRGGWFHTGDLGVMMPDGYMRIRDRSKDIIISGGENISSIEIEDTLYRHPAVSVAAVVAMPDAKWGEVPCAFVELKEGAEATAEEIIAHCRLFLASFKLPKAVRFGELPKTSTGKIQKFELRARVKSGSAIDLADGSASSPQAKP